jgi:tetratricopeptide (TPR) repeat protein
MTRKDRTRRASGAFGLAAALWAGTAAYAQLAPGYPDSVEAYDAREVAMLPPFCKHTQLFRRQVPGGGSVEEIERWTAVMGPIFETMHHYCWGLMKTHRALYLVRERQARQFYLSDSIAEFDYVITRAPEDFILLPEILTKKGENLVRLGKGPVGITQFERAVELKPDYWPPYAYMSDYFKDAGDPKKAKEILERGLASAPDAKALQRRLAGLESVTERRKKAP